MQPEQNKTVLNALMLVMRPIVRILLRYGIGYREFAEVVKTAFVSVASADFGIRGRQTNISRVAVMTGLTRKEVRRIRTNLENGDSRVQVKTTPLTEVLHHWYSQAAFMDANGKPRTLPFVGDQNSFSNLVKEFGGDIPAGAMRTEMKRVGVVTENDDGSLTLIGRVYRPGIDLDNLLTALVHGVYPLLSNVSHNTDPDRPGDTWTSRFIFSRTMSANDRPRMRRIAGDRISEFSEAIDDLFIAYEDPATPEDSVRNENLVSIGVYYFEELDKNASYDW